MHIHSCTSAVECTESLSGDRTDDTCKDIAASADAHSCIACMVYRSMPAVCNNSSCTFEDYGYIVLFGIFLSNYYPVVGYHLCVTAEKSCHFANVGSDDYF